MKSPKNMVLALVLSAVVVQSSSAGFFDRFQFQRPEWTKNVVAKVWNFVPKQTPKVIAKEVVATVGGAALIVGLFKFHKQICNIFKKDDNNNNLINLQSDSDSSSDK